MNVSSTEQTSPARRGARHSLWPSTLALALLARAAFAVTDTWVGASGNNFSTTANWTYSSGSGPVASGDTLVFGGAGSTTPNNDLTGFTFNNLGFVGTTLYTLGGNPFTLASGGSITNGASVTQIINNSITLTGSGATINPSVASANCAITLGGSIGGAANLTKSGGSGSVLTLSGVNTFSGVLAFNSGTVNFTTPPNPSGANLGNPSGITFGGNSTTTLLPSSGAGSVTISYPTITVSPSSTAMFKNGAAAGTIYEISAKVTGAGNCKQNTPTTTGAIVRFSNDTSDYTGVFSMAAGTVEFTSVANATSPSALGAGSGTYAIINSSSAATFRYIGSGNTSSGRTVDWQGTTGPLTLDSSGSGSVQFLATGNFKSGAGAATLTLRGTSTGANTLAQVINDSTGTTTLTKSDAGLWILSGANNYGGLTTVGAGTLQLSGSGTLGSASGGLTLSGGTLDLGGSSQTKGTVTISAASAIQNGTLTGSTFSSTLSSGTALVSANLAGGGAALTHSAGGTLALYGLNTFGGGATISGSGILLITNDAGLGNSGGGLTFSGNGILAATNNAAPQNNPVTVSASRTITVNGGITANFFTPDTNNLVVAAKITGPGNVQKRSSSFQIGTVRFGNDTSDYTGDLTLGFGNTEFTSVADQGAPSSLGAGATASGGQITINNATSSGTLRYVGSGNSSTHRPFNWTATTGTYTLDASGGGAVQYLATGNLRSGTGGNASLYLRGSNTGANTLAQVVADLNGVTGLTKNDAGTWALTAANTYSGATLLVGGALLVNATETPGTSGPLGSGGTIYLLGGTLRYSAADTADYSSRFCTTNNQLCRIDCNGQNVTFASPLSSSGGSLTVSSSSAGGSLTLATANTYSGSTTVSSGALLVNGSLAGSAVTVNGGALGGSGAIASPVSVQSAGTLQPGPGAGAIGTLTVNNTLDLAGNAVFQLNRTNAQTADLLTGISTVTYGGTLTVLNIGDPLQAGDSFTLFSAAIYNPSAFAVTDLPPLANNLVWDTTRLAVDGTISVGQAPTLTLAPQSQTVECAASATFTVAGAGLPAPAYQWTVNGSPIDGATSTIFTTNNVHSAGSTYTIAVTATNIYGSVSSNATLTVQDTVPPVLTLNDANIMTVECHSTFTDPGALALDACVGPVSAVVSGSVDANTPGTYTLTYTANDGNGNIGTTNRTVHVVDTTAPIISWSFTNLNLSADGNCQAFMPDVTGTNYILATDSCSASLTITQTPTNNAVLPLGTNQVVLAVDDGNGNVAYSTNTIVVADTTPPVITNCAPDQVLTAGYGGTATLPNLTSLVVAGDACSASINIVQSPAPGAELAVGASTVVFYVDDGHGNTNSCSTAVTVNAATLVPPVILSHDLVGGNFQLTFSGPEGQPYHVLASPDLAVPVGSWSALDSGTFGATSATYTDTSTASQPVRFFRIVSP